MKDLIKRLLREGFLTEAKSVGTLYHFTNYMGLIGIVDTDFRLTSSVQPYVSFTRNRLFKSSTIPMQVRLTINGDALSNKYRISSYADMRAGYGRTSEDESEERINLQKYPNGVYIKQYLQKIDIINPANVQVSNDEDDFTEPPYLGHYMLLTKRLKQNNIPFNVVNKF
jgi:hypothetical protein